MAEGMVSTTAVAEGSALTELRAFSAKQWKALQNGIVADLRTARGDAWVNATRSVIILSLMFKDKVDFTEASASLLNTFLAERDEQRCILALAAIHLIGDHDTMAYLSQHVNQEPSPRVRYLIRAAVADYLGTEDYYGRHATIEVGRPVPIPDK